MHKNVFEPSPTNKWPWFWASTCQNVDFYARWFDLTSLAWVRASVLDSSFLDDERAHRSLGFVGQNWNSPSGGCVVNGLWKRIETLWKIRTWKRKRILHARRGECKNVIAARALQTMSTPLGHIEHGESRGALVMHMTRARVVNLISVPTHGQDKQWIMNWICYLSLVFP